MTVGLALLVSAATPIFGLDAGTTAGPSDGPTEQLEVRLRLTPAGRLAETEVELRERELDLVLPLRRAPDASHGQLRQVLLDRERLSLPVDTVWRLDASAPGFWFPPRTLTLASPTHASTDSDADPRANPDTTRPPLVLDAYPTATLLGSVTVPASETPPTRLHLRFQPAPQGPTPATGQMASGGASGEVICPLTTVAETSSFRCDLPAGVHDLRLRADRFLSHFRWDLRLAAGRRVDLGTFALQPGASVVGWVTVAQGTLVPDRCQVTLSPQLGGWADPGTRGRHRALDLHATVNERGFFSFPGVAPGQYRLAATHPGFATARLAPVTVLQRAETEVLALELQPPARLDLVLSPPTDPFAAPWSVALSQDSPVPGHASEVYSRSANAEGELSFDELEPAAYSIRVVDGRGSHWHQREVELHSGSQTVDIHLPRRRVAGTLWLGDEPLAADLWFGGFHGAERIGVRSNEDGRFYVFLPSERESFRQVDIHAPQASVWVTLEDIEIPEAAAGADWPELELRLPDTRLAGEVVDAEGQPARDALVHVEGTRQLSVAADGSFLLRGLDTGPRGVQARAQREGRSLRSDYLEARVQDADAVTGDLRLVLHPDLQLDGLVLDPSGRGLPGASLVAAFTLPAPPLGRAHRGTSEAHTDVEGAFVLDLPPAARDLDLFVFPPGFAAQALRLTLPLSESLIVTADAAGGTLNVSYDAEAAEDRGGFLRRATTIEFDGRPLAHWWALSTWAEVQGVRQPAAGLVVPGLPSGAYRVCLHDRPEPLEDDRSPGSADSGSQGADCTEGWLAPYGELAVTLREPD